MIKENTKLKIATENDLDLLFEWENDPAHWSVGNRTHAYTREQLMEFLLRNESLLPSGDIRFLILEDEFEEEVGVLDLFEYDEGQKRANVAILVTEAEDRRKGYGSSALMQLDDLAKKNYGIKELRASIQMDNTASQGLFTKAGYSFKKKTKEGNLLFAKTLK